MEEIFLANSQTTKPIAPLVNTLFRLLRPASVNPKITARSKINSTIIWVKRVVALFLLQHRTHESLGIKDLQLIDGFAYTNVAHRYFKLIDDTDNYSTFGSTI